MKKLFFTLFAAASCLADPDFNGSTNVGLATASSVTYGTNLISSSCWIYVRRTNGNYQNILDSSTALASGSGTNPRWVLGIGLRDSLYVLECIGRASGYRSQYLLAAPNLDLNKWYHIGAVWDCSTSAGAFKMYVNGTNVTLTTSTLSSMGVASSPTTPWQANTFCVGSENTNKSPFNGTVSEVAIWDKELTANQFLNLARGVTPLTLGIKPIAYWPMHITGSEPPGDIIGGNTLSKAVTITNTNNSPASIYRP